MHCLGKAFAEEMSMFWEGRQDALEMLMLLEIVLSSSTIGADNILVI